MWWHEPRENRTTELVQLTTAVCQNPWAAGRLGGPRTASFSGCLAAKQLIRNRQDAGRRGLVEGEQRQGTSCSSGWTIGAGVDHLPTMLLRFKEENEPRPLSTNYHL